MKPDPTGSWAKRYESVRPHGLVPALESSPLGLSLLARHGVARWIEQWSGLEQPASAPRDSSNFRLIPGAWQTPLTQLLAHIALQHFHSDS
jgi:hypothetical protein